MNRQSIIHDLGVASKFDAAAEAERRIAFLVKYLRSNGAKAYVLEISGGVDSLTAGLLAQLAVRQVREMGQEARFIAVRLPYGIQKGEADAQASLDLIKPDRTVTVDIKPAADALFASVLADAGAPYQSGRTDTWVKSKCRAGHEVVIGGHAKTNGKFRSLPVGVHRGDHFVYVRRVGTGFGAQKVEMLLLTLKALEATKSPGLVPRGSRPKWCG